MKPVSFISSSLILILWLLVSCGKNNDNSPATICLKRSDYADKINVTGTVQAVVNFPVMAPRNMFGQTTVVKLAQDGAFVKTGDTICVLSAPELESMYREKLTAIENLEADLKKLEADSHLNIALLEAQLAINEAQTRISSLDSLQMKYATDINKRLLELEIRKTMIEKQKTEKKLAATRAIADVELKQKTAMIMQERSRLQSFADQVAALTIKAQREGVVMRTESPRIMFMGPQGMGSMGGPIREGSTLFMNSPVLQFPDLSKMQVSADVPESEFRKIEKGQKVNILVGAAQMLLTTGKVNRKSLGGRTAERYSDSKVRFYEVIIDADSCHTKMKPGLSADCEIILAEARDTIFIPSMAIFDKDNLKIVYVRNDKLFKPVPVETGTTGSSYTLIKQGLKGDETIALTEPPYKLIEHKAIADSARLNIMN